MVLMKTKTNSLNKRSRQFFAVILFLIGWDMFGLSPILLGNFETPIHGALEWWTGVCFIAIAVAIFTNRKP